MSTEMYDLENDDKGEMATLEQFERCMDTCGFGKYQWRMLAVSLMGALAQVSILIYSPYTLLLGDHEKYMTGGLTFLFLMPYIGMIFSSAICGFMSDSLGRKKVVVFSYASLTVATLLEGVSHNYVLTVFAKFCEGLFLGGAFVASTTLQSEFQTQKSRDRIIVTINFFTTMSHAVLALLGYLIPHIGKSNGVLVWKSGIIFNSILSLAACLLYVQFPESPKYDFVHGQYKNALQTVKRIYSVNTGKSSDEFPYQLLGMTDNELKSHREQVQITWSKVRLLLQKTLLKYLVVIMAIQAVFTFGYSTLRQWHPKLLTVIGYSRWTYFNSSTYLCGAFEENDQKLVIDIIQAFFHYWGNYVVIFLFSLIPYILIMTFINVGKRLIVLISLFICCSCIISMQWINIILGNIIAYGVFMTFGQIVEGLIQATVIEIFPVWIKSLALSLALTASAIGAVLSQVMFPSLVLYGCALAYVVAVTVACAAILVLFLPK